MFNGVVVDELVDFIGGHAGMDFFSNQVENSRIDFAGFPDPLDIFFVFDQALWGYLFAAQFHRHQFTVKVFMAFLIFLAGSAPARIVALNHCLFSSF